MTARASPVLALSPVKAVEAEAAAGPAVVVVEPAAALDAAFRRRALLLLRPRLLPPRS